MDSDTSDDEIIVRDPRWCLDENYIKKRSIINESNDEDKENQDIVDDFERSDKSYWGKRLRKRRKSSLVEENCVGKDEDDSLTAVIREVKLSENRVPVKFTAHAADAEPSKSDSSTRRRTRQHPSSTSPDTDLTPSAALLPDTDLTPPTAILPYTDPATPTAPSPVQLSRLPTTRSMMDLPNELLHAILVRVPGRAAGQVSRVCTSFYRFYQESWVWRELCRNELGLEVAVGEEAKNVYKHVHFHYGALQGYFMRCGVPGGGLLKVVFKNKCLVATDIQIDRFNKRSLDGLPIETDIFSIKLNNISNISKLSRQNKISADCLFPGPRSPHQCEIFVKRFDKSKLDENAARTPQPGFSIRCPKNRYQDHSESALKTWVNKSRIIEQTYDNFDRLGFTPNQLLGKLQTAFKFGFSYTALKEQSALPSVPEFDIRDTLIRHGLYVGDFLSDSGYQIVNLTYESFERLPYLLCRKVTSDGHVTAGLITLRAKMENIKVIDWDWKRKPTIEEVRNKEHVTYIELDDLKNRPPRKFSLPKRCEFAIKPPAKCRTVFRGEMMIKDGHREWKWEWAEGYIVVFSDDLFGFLNLRINYFHVFSKMKLDN